MSLLVIMRSMYCCMIAFSPRSMRASSGTVPFRLRRIR